MSITIRDVAHRAGVSVTPASRALNGTGPVSDGVRRDHAVSGGLSAVLRGPLVLLLMAAAALSGCRRVDRADVVGRYVLGAGEGRDVLELRPDGMYLHRYTTRTGAVVLDSASWELVRDRGSWIRFHAFADYYGHEAFPRQSLVRGVRIVELEMGWGGGVRLIASREAELRYVRQKSASTGW
jgi:hypothetical protein